MDTGIDDKTASQTASGIHRLPGEQSGGCLYLVATPIGNLEDITYRALRVLREVDLIAAEDTRHTRKLLNHFDIAAPLTSYHEHNRVAKGAELLEKVKAGTRIAVVTDAGMPGISDPGHDLVVSAWQEGVPVVVIPGASAGILALVLSGLKTNRFVFVGFLSMDKKLRREQIELLQTERGTSILYEAPHRLLRTLTELAPHLENRQIMVARELTKKFEEAIRGNANDLIAYFQERTVKGEFVLVIEGCQVKLPGESGEWWAELSLREHVDALIEQGYNKKDAIKETAKVRKMPKREVYQEVVADENQE